MEVNKLLLEWAKENSISDILNLSHDEKAIFSLKSIDLSNKNLHELPSFLFELKSLENLNLSHNHLKELPKEVLKLESLKTLDISWNHITHSLEFLPSSIKIYSAWNR
jgi:Leucine-rich repeat (LRR) protein